MAPNRLSCGCNRGLAGCQCSRPQGRLSLPATIGRQQQLLPCFYSSYRVGRGCQQSQSQGGLHPPGPLPLRRRRLLGSCKQRRLPDFC